MAEARKAFTLIELMTAIAVFLFILGASAIAFSYLYREAIKNFTESAIQNAVYQSTWIINSDLQKAGYGIENTTEYKPVEWNKKDRKLIIRYVNYQRNECENKLFSSNDSCSYEIDYVWKEDRLLREVDEGANGTASAASLYDPTLIKVTNFTVKIDEDSYPPLVSYLLEIETKSGKNLKISNTIPCYNWKKNSN